jgi:hypothetical protein
MDSASSSPPVERYKSFAAFYPFYISEHAHAVSRRLHVVGTSLVIVCLVLGLALDWRFFVAAPLTGYEPSGDLQVPRLQLDGRFPAVVRDRDRPTQVLI